MDSTRPVKPPMMISLPEAHEVMMMSVCTQDEFIKSKVRRIAPLKKKHLRFPPNSNKKKLQKKGTFETEQFFRGENLQRLQKLHSVYFPPSLQFLQKFWWTKTILKVAQKRWRLEEDEYRQACHSGGMDFLKLKAGNYQVKPQLAPHLALGRRRGGTRTHPPRTCHGLAAPLPAREGKTGWDKQPFCSSVAQIDVVTAGIHCSTFLWAKTHRPTHQQLWGRPSQELTSKSWPESLEHTAEG